MSLCSKMAERIAPSILPVVPVRASIFGFGRWKIKEDG